MKRKLLSMLAVLITFFSIQVLHAQTDVTSTYLTNPGFDEVSDWTFEDRATVGDVIEFQVTGWTHQNPINWSLGLVYEYESGYVFIGATVPDSDINGNSEGSLLVVTIGWGSTISFGQQVALPAGRYRMEYEVYNAGTVTEGKSAAGFVPETGGAFLSSKSSFPAGVWEVDHVDFTLTELTYGNIQVGLISVPGVSSNFCAKLCFDNVKLYTLDFPSQLLDAAGLLTEDFIKGGNDNLYDGIWEDLNLVTTIGDGVSVSWESSKPDVLSSAGVLTAPEGYDTSLTLTATLSYDENGTVYTYEKTFTVLVLANNPIGLIASWDFEKASYSQEEGKILLTATGDAGSFQGSFENGASTRIIGEGDNQFTVIDLGAENGYFDMGKEIGKTIYQLEAGFSMGGYFLVEEEAVNATANGNFMWCFSNSDQNATDKNGSIFGRPWAANYSITTGHWASGISSSVNKSGVFVDSTDPSDTQLAYRGTWHHMFYSQTGTTGTLYIDGEEVASNIAVNVLPYQLRIDGREGTDYNYLGRSQYADNGDKYFDRALLYDFRLYAYGLSGGDMGESELNVYETLQNLNDAYDFNSGKGTPSNLETAAGLIDVPTEWLGATINPNETLPALPLSVEGYPEIMVIWTPSNPDVFDENGHFIHHYYDATLSNMTVKLIDKNTGRSLTKEIAVGATIKAGTAPNVTESGKILHFDFANTTTDKVNNITGTLENNAQIVQLGEGENTFNVLDLGSENGYFDMSAKAGQLVANLDEGFTITTYYHIDNSYTELSSNGNFVWNFSNSDNILTGQNGYFMLSAGQQRTELSSGTYNTGGISNLVLERNAENGYQQPQQGEWYFVAITGEQGLVEGEYDLNYYMYRTDSLAPTEIVTGHEALYSIGKTVKSDLLKEDKLGTNYNWIGRACFSGDKYLRNTQIYDFRIYNKGLHISDFEGAEFGNVKETLLALASAGKGGTALESIAKDAPYKVYTNNRNIHIVGLEGDEQVVLYDIAGRQYRINTPDDIQVDRPGIYILRINNFAVKVMVK
ncbi:hypothetical protein LJB91_02835 [Bacteroidales bacterium OttesenSCG-928-L03]|nr:hypothetical protein [Bacteroidales bacterium OttesenSCG-928-L03]